MINFIIENWYMFIIAAIIIAVAIYMVKTFLKMPREEQITKVQEWLLYAVT
jgi:septation ring formation regulator EzrA